MLMYARGGFKYQLEQDYAIRIPSWFPQQFRLDTNRSDYVDLGDEWLTLRRGYGWNGANAFPDHSRVMIPSAVHDAMLWTLFYNSHRAKPEPDNDGNTCYYRDMTRMSDRDYRELKHAIDRWFADLCADRFEFVPSWVMFFAVNVLSRIAPGKDQVEAHRVRVYR